jgi:hypothetical protein
MNAIIRNRVLTERGQAALPDLELIPIESLILDRKAFNQVENR